VKKSLCNDDFLNTILDEIPFPVFLMDDDVRIHVYNLAAISLFGIELGDELYVIVMLEDITERKKLRTILPIPN
jgi:PAS domain-containing protein